MYIGCTLYKVPANATKGSHTSNIQSYEEKKKKKINNVKRRALKQAEERTTNDESSKTVYTTHLHTVCISTLYTHRITISKSTHKIYQEWRLDSPAFLADDFGVIVWLCVSMWLYVCECVQFLSLLA